MSRVLQLGGGYTCMPMVREKDGPVIGAYVTGPAGPGCPYNPHGPRCTGHIRFDVPEAPNDGAPRWAVELFEPLTISPSVLCHCGYQHGFIRNGRWENAGGHVLDSDEPIHEWFERGEENV